MTLDRLQLTVSTFPNAKALPLWIAQEVGLFGQFGLDIEIHETESSKVQREMLVAGTIDLAQAAVDNSLALIRAGHDTVIVMGGEGGMNDFIVQSGIVDFRGMAGRTLVVDSPDTAYALQARTLLSRAGLTAGVDYQIRSVGNASLRLKAMLVDPQNGGAVMNPPFSSEARLRGMRSLGRLNDLLGPYQAGGAFVLRAWAQAHAHALVRYIRAYVSALRWLADPAHRSVAVDTLMRHLQLTPEVAAAAYSQLTDPTFGFTPDARIDMEGVHNMLAIRTAMEGAGVAALDPAGFVDLSYYGAAMEDSTRS